MPVLALMLVLACPRPCAAFLLAEAGDSQAAWSLLVDEVGENLGAPNMDDHQFRQDMEILLKELTGPHPGRKAGPDHVEFPEGAAAGAGENPVGPGSGNLEGMTEAGRADLPGEGQEFPAFEATPAMLDLGQGLAEDSLDLGRTLDLLPMPDMGLEPDLIWDAGDLLGPEPGPPQGGDLPDLRDGQTGETTSQPGDPGNPYLPQD